MKNKKAAIRKILKKRKKKVAPMPKINTIASKKTQPVLGETFKQIVKHKNFADFDPETIPEVDITDEISGLHTDAEGGISEEKEPDMDEQPKRPAYRRKDTDSE